MLINMMFLEQCLAQNALWSSYTDNICNSPTSLTCAEGSQVKKSMLGQSFNWDGADIGTLVEEVQREQISHLRFFKLEILMTLGFMLLRKIISFQKNTNTSASLK